MTVRSHVQTTTVFTSYTAVHVISHLQPINDLPGHEPDASLPCPARPLVPGAAAFTYMYVTPPPKIIAAVVIVKSACDCYTTAPLQFCRDTQNYLAQIHKPRYLKLVKHFCSTMPEAPTAMNIDHTNPHDN